MNDPKSQSEYIEYRDKFDKSLVTIFPDRLPNNMLGYGFSAPYENSPGGLYLMTKYYSKKEYLKIKAKYSERAKYQKAATDKCLFLINNFEEMNQEKCDGFYPIPMEAIFETSVNGETKSKAIGSEVLFIDLKPGDFLEDNDKHSRYDLPESWTHGYSTGVTVNDIEKTIQYWVVVW